MCGIAGVIATNQQVIEQSLVAMNDAQRHRGPDDCGTSVVPFGNQRRLGLAHRRLSIIDLSCAGHQPMVHPRTGDQIIFNGEIYNFARLARELRDAGDEFQGHSDTEVLLHALTRFGPPIISRLEGMFAFAFYNAQEQTLVLARDSVGIKPLYVTQHNGSFLFASEVRAILASNLVARSLDRRGIAGLLAYGAVQQPLTLFEGVQSFPPGSYQVIQPTPEGFTPSSPVRFWNYPDAPRAIHAESAIAAVRQTLDEAVRDHLVADVPVGVFLSSGLDSTIVAALAAKHSPHIRSFTVGFADQPDLSEASLATETAQHFGLEHTNVTIDGADAAAQAIEWLDALDQPSMDGLNVYVISKAVRAHGITVALSGQGGDELFGGYPSFVDVPRLMRLMRRLRAVPAAARSVAGGVAMLRKPRAVRLKFQDMLRTDGSLLELYLQRRRAMSNAQLRELGVDAASLGLDPTLLLAETRADANVRQDDPVFAISQLESRFYQGNMLLRDGDANGMAHSLEIRVPILDRRMLDLTYSLPGDVRLPSGGAAKHLLRKAFSTELRPALLEQKKRGFTLPIRRWMLGPLREMCEQANAALKDLGLFRPQGVDAIWQAFTREPESPAWSRAFTLLVLGHYIRRNT